MAITQIYVNLPVTDVDASKRFYEALGASINPQFTDETSAQVVFSDTVYAQIMSHETFQSFTKFPIAKEGIEVINALAAESREEVDRIVDAAVATGGTEPRPVQDMGWLYNRAFTDPDGHLWEVLALDESAMSEPTDGGSES